MLLTIIFPNGGDGSILKAQAKATITKKSEMTVRN